MDENTNNPNVNPNMPPETPPPSGGTPPQSTFGAGPTSAQPAPIAPPSSEEKTLALLCHLLGLFTSFVGPLILWLIKKDESKFVDDQGKEALNFQITVLIASLIASLLTFICIGFLLLPAIGIADIVFCILAAIAANKGEAYRYPATIRLIK
ncbi:MAG: DUF4870 domain-containing protein [Planctomycetaceae bacterium]|nr:DUF4870 domain-containing protein [Planctomycetaceae bacterium]